MNGRASTVARGTAPEETSRTCTLPPGACLGPFSCPKASVSAGTGFSRSASVCVAEPGCSAGSPGTPNAAVSAGAALRSGAAGGGERGKDGIGERI